MFQASREWLRINATLMEMLLCLRQTCASEGVLEPETTAACGRSRNLDTWFATSHLTTTTSRLTHGVDICPWDSNMRALQRVRSGKLCPKLASPAVGQAVARSRVSSANHLETSGRLWRKRIILGIVCTNKLQATLQVHAHAANRAPLCFCKILRSLLLKLS